jgi:hypothetical protein
MLKTNPTTSGSNLTEKPNDNETKGGANVNSMPFKSSAIRKRIPNSNA